MGIQILELKELMGLLLQQCALAPFPPVFRLEKAFNGFSCPVSRGCWVRRDRGQAAHLKNHGVL